MISLAMTLIALFAGALAALRTPRPVLLSYWRSFAQRHGVGTQIGVTVLATITLSMVAATLLEPGARPLMQAVDAAVVVCGVLAGTADLYLFSRRQKGGP